MTWQDISAMCRFVWLSKSHVGLYLLRPVSLALVLIGLVLHFLRSLPTLLLFDILIDLAVVLLLEVVLEGALVIIPLNRQADD